MTVVEVVALGAAACVFPLIGVASTVTPARYVGGPDRLESSNGDNGPLIRLGRIMRGQFGRPPDRSADAATGRAVAVILVLGTISTNLALSGALVAVVRPIFKRRAELKRRSERIASELPELIDLYTVALQGGHNVATATGEVAFRGKGLIAESLQGCIDQAAHGRPLSDALEELSELVGPPVRPLVAALVASDRGGVSIVDSLATLAEDVRMQRRRHAETAARRLPIAMLFPLVVCVLPAFMFLTVVPVLVEALTGLDP